MGKKTYGTEEELRESIARNQKKLIPLNIFVMVLCLVAAITLFVCPFISIDLSKASDVVDYVFEMVDDSNTGSEDSSSSSSSSGSDMYISLIKSALDIIDIKIELSTLTLTQFAFSDDPGGYISTAVTSTISSFLKENDEQIITEVVLPAAISMIAENTDIEGLSEVDTDTVVASLRDILECDPDNESQVDAAIDDFIDTLQEEVKKITYTTENGETIDFNEIFEDEEIVEQIKETLKDYYYIAVDAAAGEEVTLEVFICAAVSDVLSTEDEKVTFSSYDELITYVTDMMSQLTGSDSTSAVQGAVAVRSQVVLTDSEESGDSDGSSTTDALAETINEMVKEYIQYVQIVCYVLYVFIGLWVILFLFALLHTFTKNKRFMMWYVKLLGLLPCLIFHIAPQAFVLLLPTLATLPALAASLTTEVIAIITAAMGMISSLTWISGGCYVLLWLVSIFWAFPIKHRIRRDKKYLKRVLRMQRKNAKAA